MATLQSGKRFTVPTFFGMCCRSEWQERMYIYKWHEVDQTKHEIFCVHIVCNEIQVKVNLEITTFFFYLRFPYCPNFFWLGLYEKSSIMTALAATSTIWNKNLSAQKTRHVNCSALTRHNCTDPIAQGCQTQGPRAYSGPPHHFMWPARAYDCLIKIKK